ncbi:MAG: response regulator [Chloroflexi bacterium]|nr:response regulator [Chloroflexota bacterium]
MKKVLLADDEDGVLALVSATLGNDNRYILITARDGEEALTIARRELPDLIFLDIMMPKMDGYQVCQALKQSPATRQIRIVMLTAMAQDANRERAKAAGADDYFTKPFSPTALLEKVSNLLQLK